MSAPRPMAHQPFLLIAGTCLLLLALVSFSSALWVAEEATTSGPFGSVEAPSGELAADLAAEQAVVASTPAAVLTASFRSGPLDLRTDPRTRN